MRADGMVTSVTADRIEVTQEDGTADPYRLQKFVRSNQATCINQQPLVALWPVRDTGPGAGGRALHG